MQFDDPFATPSDLPYQCPPFDRIEAGHYLPAFERGMADHRAEVEAIVNAEGPPTFENTVVALERAGRLLDRVSTVFFSVVRTDTTPELQAIEAGVAPQLASHSDAIFLDERLFARVDELYERRAELDLAPESAWLLERYHTDFVRAGAKLSAKDQERLREINQELSSLTTTFGANLLAETNNLSVTTGSAEDLDGLSEDAIAAAKRSDGSYGIDLRLFTNQPELASLHNRELRRRLHEASISRGARGNEHDNREVVRQITALRAEHAALLGFESHAAYEIADTTAGTAERVAQMLASITPAAVANAEAEAADLQKLMPEGETLQPWDWSYYAEKLRRERYEIDAAELRPYFEMEQVLVDGVFFAAGRLYGLQFDERFDLPTYNPEVRVFEVFEADGTPLGLFMADLYTRDSKRGGAWMNSFVKQSRLFGASPLVVVNLNVPKPPEGDSTLLTFDEVRTLFHEFGHALHGLFSSVEYPRFAATGVPRDFVEYPSQVNEMWALWPEVLANYARHHVTGEPIPEDMVERLNAARRFNEGFATTEYLAATLLDQAWHRIGADDQVDDVLAFEAAALEEAGVALDTVPPRYRTTYFSHAFSGLAYSGRYYSYIWSEVLDADSVDWFNQNGGLLRENGDHFRAALLSRGGSKDAMEAFRDFRGSDPRIEPLLKRRGLTS